MDYFIKRYTANCKELLTPYGFKRCGVNYIRVINDVLQCVGLKKYSGGFDCDVMFEISPLCVPDMFEIHPRLPSGRYILRMFEGMVLWKFDKNSQESIDFCIDNIMMFMNKYLVPFFEQGIDCKSAYYQICEFEKLAYKNRIRMMDYYKYCMALKFGDYNLALEHIKPFEQGHVNAMESRKANGWLTEEERIEREDKLAKLRKEIELVSIHDIEFIKNFIKENEVKSLKILEKFIK